MTTKWLIGKAARFLDPPATGGRRRRSHRRGGSATTRRGSTSVGRQNGQQNGPVWRCQACNRRTVDPCTEVSEGMPPCGFCIACCPGHPDTDKGRRTDARDGEDGGRFRSSVQKAGE
jgi:hypothetical protein